MPCCQHLKDEFTWKNLWLDFENDRVFYACQWRLSHPSFCVFRVLLAVYTAVIMTWGIYNNPHDAWTTLTHWTFILLTIHINLAAALSIAFYRRETTPADPGLPTHVTSGPPDDLPTGLTSEVNVPAETTTVESGNIQKASTRGSEMSSLKRSSLREGDTSQRSSLDDKRRYFTNSNSNQSTSKMHSPELDVEKQDLKASGTAWYFKLSWLLSNIAIPVSTIVTLLYWPVLYPKMYVAKNKKMSQISAHLHAGNLAVALLDALLSARPVRLVHVYQSSIGGIIYILFNITYYLLADSTNGANVIYSIMDWGKPGRALPLALGTVFVVLPTVHWFYFELYHIKLKCYLKIYGHHFK